MFHLAPILPTNRNIATLLGANQLLSRKEATLNAFLLFTTWHARTEHLQGYKTDLRFYFTHSIITLMRKHCQSILKMSKLAGFLGTATTIPTTSLGRTGTRTKQQVAAAKEAAQRILDSTPANSIIAFTDGGTHKSNPGPCGSGIHFLNTKLDITVSLGWGTNNLGELVGIGTAISHALLSHPAKGTEIHILTDSFFSYGILELYWNCSTYPNLARIIRKLILHAKHKTPIFIHWIAAHAGIAGNEAADANATIAAENSGTDKADTSHLITSWSKILDIPPTQPDNSN
jgi:ribonuclease HI